MFTPYVPTTRGLAKWQKDAKGCHMCHAIPVHLDKFGGCRLIVITVHQVPFKNLGKLWNT